MKKNIIKIYILELLLIIFLFFSFLFPNIINRNNLSIFLFIYMIIVRLMLKKRIVFSIYKDRANVLMLLLAFLYVGLFYFFGVFSGFKVAKISLSVHSVLTIIIPLIIIILSSEVIRNIFLGQKVYYMNKNISALFTFISMVLIDLVVYINIYDLHSVEEFFEALGFIFFASLSCNFLYNYISSRFGVISIIIYRLITCLYVYVIPIVPDIYIFFSPFFRMLYPYLIFLIFENKYRESDFVISLGDKKKNIFINIISIIIIVLTIMLISCQFKYGILVVGSRSMENNINFGDAIIYESYNNEVLEKGQVIVFNYNGIKTIHRVVDIKNFNGEYRVYTKGDANNRLDYGYRTMSDIEGIVILKIKYIGYPTLWVYKLFS